MSAEGRIPAEHPLRTVRKAVDEVLRGMSQDFDAVYADTGRHSMAPERLLRAGLLQCFYSLRSERMRGEQIHSRGLFRWFVGLDRDALGSCAPSVVTPQGGPKFLVAYGVNGYVAQGAGGFAARALDLMRDPALLSRMRRERRLLRRAVLLGRGLRSRLCVL